MEGNRLRARFGALMLASAGVVLASPVLSASAADGQAVTVLQTAHVSTAIALDPVTHTVTSLAGPASPTGRSGETYTCIYSSSNAGFRAYPVAYATGSTSAYYIQYDYFPYSVDNARYLSGEGYTFQVEMCSTGGGDTFNGNNQCIDGTAVSTGDTSPVIIGQKWGTGVQGGTVSATIGLQVSAGPVSISGSTTVTGSNTYTGSQGPSGNAPDLAPYSRNEVNGYWQSGCTFIFQGTSDFEGNVDHGLWEYAESDTSTHNLYGEAYIEYFCGHPFGIGC